MIPRTGGAVNPRATKPAFHKTLKVDGGFGAKTQSGVRVLQKQLALAADGVVGKDTWKAVLTALE